MSVEYNAVCIEELDPESINFYPPLWFEMKYQMELNAGITLAAKLNEWKTKDTPALKKARERYQAYQFKKAS
ncbi:hypothetical protein L9F34_000312 [Klebsiella aerogenes]|uniref:hypothetical protein n=1 Tax=Klebsiella TaxID=570 RepID=UPI000F7E9785|nr:hypothetical protein [Klebsiella aerogenes]EKV3390532.1 hypothetical protein [Klebsiella aerogenes]EMF0746003.1 hypothetical protein [Klebsiella aerogenes]KAE9484469.1 hypothetical protein F8B42_00258 [Klebsiella aerogenes]MEB6079530.1 hypothetical protein [Klebsiella aerogenes]RSW53143.1 hypothetical protein EGH44_06225 [Klebsiella aerogenes]